MKKSMATLLHLLKQAFKRWQDVKAPRLAAALAYYTAFSLAPLLIIAIAVAGLVFGREAAQGQILAPLQGLLGAHGAQSVQSLISASSRPSSGIIATAVGVIGLLLGAAGIFGELQDSLNTIWEAPAKKRGGLWATIRSRFLSLGMVFVVAFLLLVSLVISTALTAVLKYVGGLAPGLAIIGIALNFLLSWVIISAMFAGLLKYLPDVEPEWRDVIGGAALTGLLFIVGQYLISFYLGLKSGSSSYGAAGSLLVVLIWVYYSAQIFLFGAAFTRVYSESR